MSTNLIFSEICPQSKDQLFYQIMAVGKFAMSPNMWKQPLDYESTSIGIGLNFQVELDVGLKPVSPDARQFPAMRVA